MFSLFSSTKLASSGSSTSLSELDQVAALKETIEGLNFLLNDDLVGVSVPSTILTNRRREAIGFWLECIPQNGSFSSQLPARVDWIRARDAQGGYNPEWLMLTSATERISDAETSAERQRKLAIRDNRSQGRYDAGMSSQLS